ncbi:hypothetical protein J437_LFUL000940 [Ladona fulva]|uniref:Uncharacterized protein n=1 Tax=Ladona fulva TaxID=123851 RepID=A0A8K0K6P8_LADFU|nr:hypothetical protein J437_LFUL000940 [Ladona fulva]
MFSGFGWDYPGSGVENFVRDNKKACCKTSASSHLGLIIRLLPYLKYKKFHHKGPGHPSQQPRKRSFHGNRYTKEQEYLSMCIQAITLHESGTVFGAGPRFRPLYMVLLRTGTHTTPKTMAERRGSPTPSSPRWQRRSPSRRRSISAQGAGPSTEEVSPLMFQTQELEEPALPWARQLLQQFQAISQWMEILEQSQSSAATPPATLMFTALRCSLPTDEVPEDSQVLQLAQLLKQHCESGKIRMRDMYEIYTLLDLTSHWEDATPPIRQLLYHRLHILGIATHHGWGIVGQVAENRTQDCFSSSLQS